MSTSPAPTTKVGLPPSADTLSRLINLAGRQRMLSQRLTLFVVLAGQGQADALGSAADTLRQLKDSHQGLVSGGDGLPGLFSAHLRQVFDGPSQARQRIEAFIGLAERTLLSLKRGGVLHGPTQSELVDAASALLGLLTQVTQAYEHEAQQLARAQQQQRARLNEEIQAVAREARVVAFNAQVSAHRAGAAGREFAVVAARMATITEEVDQLVKASMTSA